MALNIQFIEEEILDQYLNDDNPRPWIVGFSGGKDSTMVLQMVWRSLLKIPVELRKRPIHIVCNDTLVENPKIVQFINITLEKIQREAVRQGLPITVNQTTPRLEDTFWVNLLGKGYPAPNSSFRWCTERLKINPTTEFIKRTISDVGEAIILLGTRSDESIARAKSMARAKIHIEGERLRKHPLPNAYVFAPISDVLTEELWQYLLQVNPPWGGSHRELITLYNNATGGDCPLVLDDTTPSCGGSRFGCWVCTVVKRDKSMDALIDNGEDWMEPLSDFREMLIEHRNDRDWRQTHRRNSDLTGEDIWGPYLPEKRAYMLSELLKAQRAVQKSDPHLIMINYQELVAIQVTWHRDSIFNYSVAEIYNQVYGTSMLHSDFSNQQVFENDILKQVCKSNEDFKLINELLEIQKSKYILANNNGLQNDIDTYIERHIKIKLTNAD